MSKYHMLLGSKPFPSMVSTAHRHGAQVLRPDVPVLCRPATAAAAGGRPPPQGPEDRRGAVQADQPGEAGPQGHACMLPRVVGTW